MNKQEITYSFFDNNDLIKNEALLVELCDFEMSFFPNPWSFTQWQNHLKSQRKLVALVGRGDNCLVGMVLFEIEMIDENSSNAYLHKICVHGDYRRKNIACDLLTFSRKELGRKAVINSILLEVSEKNEGAIKFYLASGFDKISLRKNFYSNGDSAISMQRIMTHCE